MVRLIRPITEHPCRAQSLRRNQWVDILSLHHSCCLTMTTPSGNASRVQLRRSLMPRPSHDGKWMRAHTPELCYVSKLKFNVFDQSR